MDIERLVATRQKIAAKRAELKKSYDVEDATFKTQQERIEAEMMRFLNDTNVDSMKTAAGLFYRQVDIQPSASDWDTVYKWISENDAFEALQRRLKKEFITTYMDENDGATPPGVSIHKKYVLRVRRA